jgi:hypothetical protein
VATCNTRTNSLVNAESGRSRKVGLDPNATTRSGLFSTASSLETDGFLCLGYSSSGHFDARAGRKSECILIHRFKSDGQGFTARMLIDGRTLSGSPTNLEALIYEAITFRTGSELVALGFVSCDSNWRTGLDIRKRSDLSTVQRFLPPVLISTP